MSPPHGVSPAGVVIHNALLVELAPRRVRRGSLHIGADGRIQQVVLAGATAAQHAGAAKGAAAQDVQGATPEQLDAGGAVVLPGLVCAHTHLYSALARGMPGPAEAPQDFRQILERVWWRLDRALDEEAIEVSALVGAVEALRCGTTTLVDHHASPAAIGGSLDVIGAALERVGLRGVLCYEVSERGGVAEALAGVAENARFLSRVSAGQRPLLRGLCGAHAAFTLGPQSAAALRQVLDQHDAALHIHLAEDGIDARKDGQSTVAWLEAAGLLRAGHGGQVPPVLAHGVHLSDEDAERLCALGAVVVHNPRSNLNNAVGYARPWRVGRLCLGTDGIGADMLAEAHAAFLQLQAARRAHPQALDVDVLDALSANHALVGRLFHATDSAASVPGRAARLGHGFGSLSPGAPADLVITDYVPPTPLLENGGNLLGHLLFGLSSRHVRHVLCAGQVVLRERRVVGLDEDALLSRARDVAARLWRRM